MTQEELDALPELHEAVVFWNEEHEPSHVKDSQGQKWDMGWYEGKRWKRKCPMPISVPQIRTER